MKADLVFLVKKKFVYCTVCMSLSHVVFNLHYAIRLLSNIHKSEFNRISETT